MLYMLHLQIIDESLRFPSFFLNFLPEVLMFVGFLKYGGILTGAQEAVELLVLDIW